MPEAPERFSEVLALAPSGEDAFLQPLGDAHDGAVFGGQTLGCTAVAAGRTCPGRDLHSLHFSFLRPLPAGPPSAFQVERLREGRRLAQRRVRVELGDRLLCQVTASFTGAQSGIAFQDARPVPEAPKPDDLPTEMEVARAEGLSEPPWWGPIEWRFIDDANLPGPLPDGQSTDWAGWVRSRFPLGDDPPLQAGAMAFLSDAMSHFSLRRRLGSEIQPGSIASLDTAIWSHHPPRWEGWWLVVSTTPTAHAGRALTRREVFDEAGDHVATFAQEMLILAGG